MLDKIIQKHILRFFLIQNCPPRVLRDFFKRCGSELFLHGSLRVHEALIQHRVDVSPYRAFRIWLLMEMEEAFLRIHTADSFVDIIERDFIKPFCQLRPAAATLRLQNTGLTQLGNDRADDDGVHPDAAGKKFTVHTVHIPEIVKGRDNMNPDCKSASDLHTPPPRNNILY